jgi:hypothetical protein
MKGLAEVSIAIFAIVFTVPQVHAGTLDDVGESTKVIRQNNRTLEKATDVINTCTTKVTNGELSKSVCDSVLQKFAIDVSKFLDENRLALEDLIYPVTVPDSVSTYVLLDSANVIGSDDLVAIGEHAEAGISYTNLIQQFAEECASAARMYDLDTVKSCMEMSDSLNDHFRNYNVNVKPEYETIGTDSGLDN